MQTRTYTELFDLVQALCGVTFASIEENRIKAFINRRAKKAFRSSNYWTRFLLIAEQFTPTDGVVLYSDPNGKLVDTFLRIYKTQPYLAASALEYEFVVTQTGAQLIYGVNKPDTVWVTCKTQPRRSTRTLMVTRRVTRQRFQASGSSISPTAPTLTTFVQRDSRRELHWQSRRLTRFSSMS